MPEAVYDLHTPYLTSITGIPGHGLAICRGSHRCTPVDPDIVPESVCLQDYPEQRAWPGYSGTIGVLHESRHHPCTEYVPLSCTLAEYPRALWATQPHSLLVWVSLLDKQTPRTHYCALTPPQFGCGGDDVIQGRNCTDRTRTNFHRVSSGQSSPASRDACFTSGSCVKSLTHFPTAFANQGLRLRWLCAFFPLLVCVVSALGKLAYCLQG